MRHKHRKNLDLLQLKNIKKKLGIDEKLNRITIQVCISHFISLLLLFKIKENLFKL